MSEKPVFRRGAMDKPIPFGAARSNSPQKQGRQREKALAKDLNGRQQPGSGCFPNMGGDVITDEFLVEHKLTSAASYSVNTLMLRKVKREAFEAHKKPAVVIEMLGFGLDKFEKWAMIPYELFKELLEER